MSSQGLRDAVAAVGKSFGEVRAPGRHSATTGSVFAVSSGEAGSVGPGANDTTSVAAKAVAESVVEARPAGIAKHSATTAVTGVDSTVAESVVEARPAGIAKHSATTAVTDVDSTVADTVDEARAAAFGKYSATTVSESELAESSDEASSSGEEAPHWIAKYNLKEFVETVKIGGK